MDVLSDDALPADIRIMVAGDDMKLDLRIFPTKSLELRVVAEVLVKKVTCY